MRWGALLLMGFTWPGQAAPVVGDLTPAAPLDTGTLVARLDDEALEVRIEAAHALGARPEATLALTAYADAPLPELRAAVVDALAHHPATPDVERVLRRALEDRDTAVVLAALRGYARHRELALPPALRVLASGVHPQLARAAQNLLAPDRGWDDPAWLRALERTTYEDPIEALEATLPDGETRAIEPLRAWLARSKGELVPRIVALIVRSGGSALPDGERK